MTGVAPGPWLRAARARRRRRTLLAVVSGAAHLGTAHRLLAALVAAAARRAARLRLARAPPARCAGPRGRGAVRGARPRVPGPATHTRARRTRARRDVVVGAQSLRERARSVGRLARLRHADEAADHDAAARHRLLRHDRRRPRLARHRDGLSRAMVGLALACGGASALNHVLDRDIDPLMGERTAARPGRVGPRGRRAARSSSALRSRRFSFVLLASTVNVLTAVLALVGNLFYVLVYTRLAEAHDVAEHRHRRRRRRRAAARRLGRRNRPRSDLPALGSCSRSSSSGRRRTSGRSRC